MEKIKIRLNEIKETIKLLKDSKNKHNKIICEKLRAERKGILFAVPEAKKNIIQKINLKGYPYEYSDYINGKDVLVDVFCLPEKDWIKLRKRHHPYTKSPAGESSN